MMWNSTASHMSSHVPSPPHPQQFRPDHHVELLKEVNDITSFRRAGSNDGTRRFHDEQVICLLRLACGARL